MKTSRLISGEELLQPTWKDLVDRWYQLDKASKVLCQTAYEWKKSGAQFHSLDQIIYIFNQGSNHADQEFAQSQGLSPAKFVYTLPNIPITIMQQMLKISVPTFCCEGLSLSMAETMVKKMDSSLIVALSAPRLGQVGAEAVDLWTVQGLLTNGGQRQELESLRIE